MKRLKYKNGKTKEYPTLRIMADTHIKRHIKIKKDANPFDTEWNEYFEKRRSLRRKSSQNSARSPIGGL